MVPSGMVPSPNASPKAQRYQPHRRPVPCAAGKNHRTLNALPDRLGQSTSLPHALDQDIRFSGQVIQRDLLVAAVPHEESGFVISVYVRVALDVRDIRAADREILRMQENQLPAPQPHGIAAIEQELTPGPHKMRRTADSQKDACGSHPCGGIAVQFAAQPQIPDVREEADSYRYAQCRHWKQHGPQTRDDLAFRSDAIHLLRADRRGIFRRHQKAP